MYIPLYTSIYIYIYTLYVYTVHERDVWHIFHPVEGVWREPRRGVIGWPRQIANYRPAAPGRQVRFATTSTTRRPTSIILRVICSALLYTVEQKKKNPPHLTPPRTTCHQQFYSRLTSNRIPFEYSIFFFTCPSQNKT